MEGCEGPGMQSPERGVGPAPLLSPARIHGDVLEDTSPPCSVPAPGMLLLRRHRHIPQALQ